MPAATAAPLVVEHVTDDPGGTLAAENLGLRGSLAPGAPEITATLPSSGPPLASTDDQVTSGHSRSVDD